MRLCAQVKRSVSRFTILWYVDRPIISSGSSVLAECFRASKNALPCDPNDTDVARADLNFYVVSVQRIREVARMAAEEVRCPAHKQPLRF